MRFPFCVAHQPNNFRCSDAKNHDRNPFSACNQLSRNDSNIGTFPSRKGNPRLLNNPYAEEKSHGHEPRPLTPCYSSHLNQFSYFDNPNLPVVFSKSIHHLTIMNKRSICVNGTAPTTGLFPCHLNCVPLPANPALLALITFILVFTLLSLTV